MAREDLLQAQLTDLRRTHPDADLSNATDGTHIVDVTLPLPAGWTRPTTHAEFLVPTAYPSAQPDCFYADVDLRLENGGMPANSGIQQLDGQQRLWFSWHLQQPWHPTKHTLRTYVRFIEERLRLAR